jgi:16S rRNA (cytosine967-C5)-methyltransferase
MAALQREILEGAAGGLRSGGALVYATCTTTREENEDVVEGFLRDHPEFHLDPVGAADGIPSALATPSGYLRTYPPRESGDPADDLDAFFAARMRRR